jgi:acetyl-CoA carboxylase biotin carboxyl carrier protein
MNEQLMEQIRELIVLLRQHKLKELTLKTDGLSLEIKNSEQEQHQAIAISNDLPGQMLSCTSKEKEDDNYFYISSPLVGTFYRSPAPSSPPFAEIGEEIEPRQTLCIIEAMKVMNEIVSEKKGRIVEFLVENGEMVDYGKALVKLETIEESSL